MRSVLGVCIFSLTLQMGCVKVAPSIHDTQPKSLAGLSQVVAFQDSLFSGAKPEGQQGMQSLADLGVKTIICVDGVPPDVQTAKRLGITTVHFPMHYNAPSEAQIVALATAVQQGQQIGSVYIHCHHGKHRSATAAAIASIALDQGTTEFMLGRMEVSDTSKHYTGLWNAVESQSRVSLLPLNTTFPSSVMPTGLNKQMISIDEAMDQLRLVEQTKWMTPINHPDLSPSADAGFIVELFRSIQLSDGADNYGVDFESKLINALHQASGLEEALLEGATPEELDQYMFSLEQSCINCHVAFRK